MIKISIAHYLPTPVLATDPQTASLSDILDVVSMGNVVISDNRELNASLDSIPVLHFSLELMFALQKVIFFGDEATISTTTWPDMATVRRSGKVLLLKVGGQEFAGEDSALCSECGALLVGAYEKAIGDHPALIWSGAFLRNSTFLYLASRRQRA